MGTDEERYEILGKLGEGGRGSVYEAYDRQLSRKVAIKRLHPADDTDPEEAYQDILKESHALSALNSPNIVRVFDVARDEDGPYVVMEFLNGKTLQEVVAKAPLVEADFYSVAAQGLEALVAAHESDILHRDIKPANLILTWLPSGRIMLKLLDFGLAKFSAAPATQTIAQGSSVFGSIYFMAPEQFDHAPLDGRTDLYALGCVFYFALTGNYPFLGDNVTQVMASHLTGNCDDLKSQRGDLPDDLCDWIMSLMAVDRDDRPSSAQEALDRLESFQKEFLKKTTAVRNKRSEGKVALATGEIAGTSAPGGVTPEGPPPKVRRPSGAMPKWFAPTLALLGSIIVFLAAGVFIRTQVVGSSEETADPDDPPAVIAGDEPGGDTPAPPDAGPPETKMPKPPGPGGAEKRPAGNDLPSRFMTQRDRNKDGELTFNEYFPTFDKDLRASERKRFDNLDLDESGTLDIAELRGKGRGSVEFFIRDGNRDAKLSLEEWLSMRSPNARKRMTETYRAKDADDDGELTLEEFRKPQPEASRPGS